jgi:transcriptional regulator with XRE-family HTH domain
MFGTHALDVAQGGGHQMTFREWLAAELASRHLSQAQLAKLLHVHQAVVSRWLNEETPQTPSPKSCERIADALGVERNAVLALAGHYHPTEGEQTNADVVAQVALIEKDLTEAIDYVNALLARLSLKRSGLRLLQKSSESQNAAMKGVS